MVSFIELKTKNIKDSSLYVAVPTGNCLGCIIGVVSVDWRFLLCVFGGVVGVQFSQVQKF